MKYQVVIIIDLLKPSAIDVFRNIHRFLWDKKGGGIQKFPNFNCIFIILRLETTKRFIMPFLLAP